MAIDSMTRDQALTQIKERQSPWDLVVIGGGATGIGIAVDAASRGLDVVLLEQSDFGKGTSSRSTKLIHGGVRYLQQGNLTLVHDALKERSLLLQNAPHLVRDISFLIPCRSAWDRVFYGTGLKLYDFLAVRDSFGNSRWVNRKETSHIVPSLKMDHLSGAILYHDGQFDDSRLLISMARTAMNCGGVLVNYCRVTSLEKNSSGEITGVHAQDQESSEELFISAKVVINATGPFSDEIQSLDNPDHATTIAPSQGVHLVVSKEFFSGDSAIIIPKTADGRVLFIIPWHDHAVIGTTDTPIPQAVLEPTPQAQEIEFLIETASAYLTKPIQYQDILSTFTGIRPLVKGDPSQKTASLSRDHSIKVASSGLITIAGGKWTTYRKMAEDCVDKAVQLARLHAEPCRTTELKLHGATHQTDFLCPRSVYGSDLPMIELLEQNHPDWAIPFCEELTLRPSEVVWAVRHEMARTIDDVLTRRSRSLLLNSRAAVAVAPRVVSVIAEELGRDSSWESEQLEAFLAIAEHYLPPQVE